MPLGTVKQTEKISTLVQRIRGNCQSGLFMDGESGKKQIDSELRGVIVYHEELIGMIPPLKTYDQLAQQLKQSQRPVPKEDDIEKIVESLASFCKDWVSVYFIPFVSPDSMAAKSVKNKIFAPRCLTQMFIKSGSLWGKTESGIGFFGYSTNFLRNQSAISEVITRMCFDNTHTAPGGTDCKGVQFAFDLPSADNKVLSHNGEIENELDFFNEVQEWINKFSDHSLSQLQSVFTIPPGFLEQLMRLEGKDDMKLEFLTPEVRLQAVSYLLANSVSSITKMSFQPDQMLSYLEPELMIDSERIANALPPDSPLNIGEVQETLVLPEVISSKKSK